MSPNDRIIIACINENLRPHKSAGYSWIYAKARKVGETHDYARFLADEWCRVYGFGRDIMSIPSGLSTH